MEDSERDIKLQDFLRKIGDLSRRGQFTEALSVAQERLDFSEKEYGINAEETLSSMLSLGDLLTKIEKYQEATNIFEKARDAASSLKDPKPSVVAYALCGMAVGASSRGKNNEARAASKAALHVMEHSSAALNIDSISELFSNIIEVLKKLGAAEDLAELYATIARISKSLDDERLVGFISKIIDASRWFAAHDDISQAGELAGRATAFLHAQGYATLEDKSFLQEILGLSELAAGQTNEAVNTLTAALEMKKQLHGDTSKEVVGSQISLADALLNEGRIAEAKELLSAAIKATRDAGEVGKNIDEARALSILGELHLVGRDFEEAKKHFNSSLSLYEKLKPSAAVEIAHLCHNIGVIALNEDSPDAVSSLERAARLRLEALGSDDFDYAQTLWALGKSYETRGRIEDARQAYRTSLDIQELYLDPSDPALVAARKLVDSFDEEVPEAAALPQANTTPLETPPSLSSIEPLPRSRVPNDPFPGNMAGHLMLAALLALENQKPDTASKILRESISILGVQRSDREKDLETSLSLLIALLEDIRPGDV